MITRDRERFRQFRGFGQVRASSTLESPLEELVEKTVGAEWVVQVYNNDKNTYEEVMTILMIATACTPEEAYLEAWEIDHYGKCGVHRAAKDVCEDVAKIISTIGIRVEVERDSLANTESC